MACATGILFCLTFSFSIFGGIPSTPDDFVALILLVLLDTPYRVTINFPNISVLDQLLFVNCVCNELISSLD